MKNPRRRLRASRTGPLPALLAALAAAAFAACAPDAAFSRTSREAPPRRRATWR